MFVIPNQNKTGSSLLFIIKVQEAKCLSLSLTTNSS